MQDLDGINTANELGIYLFRLAETPVETYEEVAAVAEVLNRAVEKVHQKPDLLSSFALDALEILVAGSPYNDIAEGVFTHEQHPRQEIALRAVRALAYIGNAVPPAAPDIVARLENLMAVSPDWQVRREALGMLDAFFCPEEKAVDALARQAEKNSNTLIRIHARDTLLAQAHEAPQTLPAALRAITGGATDPAPEAKLRALGNLKNLVRTSADLSEGQMRAISDIFADTAKAYDEIVESAKGGLTMTLDRLRSPGFPPPRPRQP